MIRCVAVSPGDGTPLLPWLDGLARVRWPAVLIREPRCEDLPGLVEAASSRVPEVWLHAGTPGAPELAASLGLRLHLSSTAPSGAGDWSVSVHTEDELGARLAAGAALVLWAPVWAPTSKPATRPPLGLERFLAAARGRPVWALGGVTPERARALGDVGAAGFAVLGGLGRAAEHARDYLTAARVR